MAIQDRITNKHSQDEGFLAAQGNLSRMRGFLITTAKLRAFWPHRGV